MHRCLLITVLILAMSTAAAARHVTSGRVDLADLDALVMAPLYFGASIISPGDAEQGAGIAREEPDVEEPSRALSAADQR